MAQTPTERVAATVRAELARRSISGRQLARHLDASPSAMHRRLSGVQPFDVAELAQVAEFLGLPLSDLVETSAA